MASKAVLTEALNAEVDSDISVPIKSKAAVKHHDTQAAAELAEARSEFVFGSPREVIPVGYASGIELCTLTNPCHLFPSTDDKVSQPDITVASGVAPTDEWGSDAPALVEDGCESTDIGGADYRFLSHTPLILVRE